MSSEPRSRRVRARSSVRDLARIAVFAGIVAALGLVPPIPLPIIPVPITAQTLGVMLAGLVLGARRGGLSMLLFLGLVALGLPLLSGGRGGLAVFVGPSAGFAIGFPFAAYAVGLFTEQLHHDGRYQLRRGVVAALLGGVGVLYVFGALGFYLITRLSPLPVLAFLPGDVLKAVVAAAVARGVHAAYPGLLAVRSRRSERDPVPA